MSECSGKYCDSGKRIQEFQDSRKGMHESLNKLTTNMVKQETKLDYISKGIDELKESHKLANKEIVDNIRNKVSYPVLLIIISIILSVAGGAWVIVWNEVTGIRDYLANYEIYVQD